MRWMANQVKVRTSRVSRLRCHLQGVVVDRGELAAIVGASGYGKSTLLNILTALEHVMAPMRLPGPLRARTD